MIESENQGQMSESKHYKAKQTQKLKLLRNIQSSTK